MFLQSLDLTTALRPSLLPDETLLLVQDCVGLYEGRDKLARLQNGHAYLTTHRACYVDNLEPREGSVAVDLKTVERCEFYAGFMKSSPKITLYPKTNQKTQFSSSSYASSSDYNSKVTSSAGTPNPYSPPALGTLRVSEATWVCQICSFSNRIPQHFEPTTANEHTPLPPCQACGIKPSFSHILKASVAAASGRKDISKQAFPASAIAQPFVQTSQQSYRSLPNAAGKVLQDSTLSREAVLECPRCTFLNHTSLLACELCGQSLMIQGSSSPDISKPLTERPLSPPLSHEQNMSSGRGDEASSIKFSFRTGGEKVFYERLKGAITQRKWLLQSAPPIPAPINAAPGARPALKGERSAGIAGLERRGLELRQKNEAVIGNAFEDLDALMASAKEIIALAESFANKSGDGSSADAGQLIAESARSLDMVTTKDVAGDESVYLSEMSRNLAEYLTDDSKGILRREGGIMSLVDLWAVFNRARGGVDLVSPSDFEKTARLWEKLKLPVRLRQFKNGLLVVQQADRTDDKTIAQLLDWLQSTHSFATSHMEARWDWQNFGRGITVQETAQHFGWSIGVAGEELAMAEEHGALCRDEDAGGLSYWENWIVELVDDDEGEDGITFKGVQSTSETEEIMSNLKDIGLL